ncbi:MAG: hypothetical protein ACI86M_000869 [Saprospiraceae bacterium]|jgi:hypothetical protein
MIVKNKIQGIRNVSVCILLHFIFLSPLISQNLIPRFFTDEFYEKYEGEFSTTVQDWNLKVIPGHVLNKNLSGRYFTSKDVSLLATSILDSLIDSDSRIENRKMLSKEMFKGKWNPYLFDLKLTLPSFGNAPEYTKVKPNEYEDLDFQYKMWEQKYTDIAEGEVLESCINNEYTRLNLDEIAYRFFDRYNMSIGVELWELPAIDKNYVSEMSYQEAYSLVKERKSQLDAFLKEIESTKSYLSTLRYFSIGATRKLRKFNSSGPRSIFDHLQDYKDLRAINYFGASLENNTKFKFHVLNLQQRSVDVTLEPNEERYFKFYIPKNENGPLTIKGTIDQKRVSLVLWCDNVDCTNSLLLNNAGTKIIDIKASKQDRVVYFKLKNIGDAREVQKIFTNTYDIQKILVEAGIQNIIENMTDANSGSDSYRMDIGSLVNLSNSYLRNATDDELSKSFLMNEIMTDLQSEVGTGPFATYLLDVCSLVLHEQLKYLAD